jgi:hypothetical protein
VLIILFFCLFLPLFNLKPSEIFVTVICALTPVMMLIGAGIGLMDLGFRSHLVLPKLIPAHNWPGNCCIMK